VRFCCYTRLLRWTACVSHVVNCDVGLFCSGQWRRGTIIMMTLSDNDHLYSPYRGGKGRIQREKWKTAKHADRKTDRQTIAVTTGSWIGRTLCFSMAITTSTFSSWLINDAKIARPLSRWLNSTKIENDDVTRQALISSLCRLVNQNTI